MAVIETVDIEDVFPLVDEYGNSMATRDYSAKENKAYVAELARSMRAKGVPDEMVTLVRDGGVYRIKAGNSRVEAMRLLGTKRFPAVVEDGATVAQVLETVIRTDTKKTYEAVEKSRFVRQLALFGDDEYVAEVAGIEPAQVAKVRRAAEAVEDAADDMSLLRLIAIADFAGDEKALGRLTNCTEKDFPVIEKELRRGREVEEKSAAIAAELEAAGVRPAERQPAGWRYELSVTAPGADLDGLEGLVAVKAWGGRWDLYREPGEEAPDPEEEERKRRRAEVDSLYGAVEESREAWLAENFLDVEKCAPLIALEADRPWGWKVGGLASSMGVTVPPMPVDALQAYCEGYGNIVLGLNGDFDKRGCKRFTALTAAMEQCGYEPCEEERRLCRMAKGFLGGDGDE